MERSFSSNLFWNDSAPRFRLDPFALGIYAGFVLYHLHLQLYAFSAPVYPSDACLTGCQQLR
jgi:hypothetical protein